ncbi:MAG: hypothetical protein NWF00_06230 [Candidatus Bathyarchaeota archaeon]|nr:hypothetical protein [Candidatus Bathyarchaeota archaeon]
MSMQNSSKAKQASIMAMTAALYAIFFFLSYSVTLPNFTLLYLPSILLGVFPVWFGWSGLVGSMVGGFIGGAFVEGLGFLGVFEAVVALLIFMLNWVFMPKMAAENGKSRNLLALVVVYALSLCVGTGYILWQYTVLPQLFTGTQALAVFVPTFALNLPIVLITCPILLKTISPRLRNWGVYSGNLWEWRRRNGN